MHVKQGSVSEFWPCDWKAQVQLHFALLNPYRANRFIWNFENFIWENENEKFVWNNYLIYSANIFVEKIHHNQSRVELTE